jgi:FkbH-like protein
VSNGSISIASTFTAEPLVSSLEMWLELLNQPAQIQFAPFNQIIQSLVDSRSGLCRDAAGLNVLLIRLSDWIADPSGPELAQQLQHVTDDFANALTAFAKKHACPNLICICPEDLPETSAQRSIFSIAEATFAKRFHAIPGITVCFQTQLQALYPVDQRFDPISNRTGHIPYSSAWFVSLGTMIARHWWGLRKRPIKLVVLDCDNTLWNGVCGEVGPTGVVIEPEQELLQRRLIELRERGVLLALCSKNSEPDVWNVFNQNPSMVLQREHISVAEISWNDKSTGLQRIANRLGLGLDSFLFLDDNPLEVAEVRANLPAVIALRLPDLEELPNFVDHIWPLDQLTATRDDQLRAASYRLEADRMAERSQHLSMRSFIEKLNLQIQYLPIDEENLARAAQLIERTNQFNLTLKRRSISELRQILARSETTGFLVEVSDKYGEYGSVGIGICEPANATLLVDTFALSCRALGRGVEYHILRHLGMLASQMGLTCLSVEHVHGERNQPAEKFLKHVAANLPRSTISGDQFSFSAESLSSLNPLDLIDAQVELVGDSELAKPRLPSLASPSDLLNQIACEFNSVEKIQNRLAQMAKPRPDLQAPFIPATDELEQQIAEIVSKVLRIHQVGIDDPLTQLGASSLQLVQIHSRLVHRLKGPLSITELYNLPTIAAIAQHLAIQPESPQAPSAVRQPQEKTASQMDSSTDARPDDIAVIGMAGRFPGADSVEELWQNLIQAVNSIVPLKEDELNLAPDSPLRSNPNLVRKSSAIRHADQFDAKFFGIFPKEAKVMDPQHRLMLECCWTALEDAGYCPDRMEQTVGVYAGCYMDTYILASLQSNPEMLSSLANSFHGGDLHTELGNDKDYLATRISYLLNLRGPAMTIQTACSTSLVAIIQACQALQNGHCEVALAGGATLKFPQHRGYLYTEGGMVSPDGVCRPFDADARGTVFGEGVAAVVLKKLEQAIQDGDDIYGVIRGWGINNDGRSKMAYTAPSVNGQSAAIEMAHRQAGFSADTISYVEAHGTGTSLGDPIEVDALTRAFRKSTDQKQFCGIGSIKSNIGHLDVAAGVSGLIKICLAMRYRLIPPTLNFLKPNPNIDFANSPFYVVTSPQPWPISNQPRRAGLSSFGVGGTNAHIVVQEPPAFSRTSIPEPDQLLILSARSAEALDSMTQAVSRHLLAQPDLNLADVAYTLQTGRKEFVHKRILVASDATEAAKLLYSHRTQSTAVFTQNLPRRRMALDFVFPGQGSQQVNMAQGLYQNDLVFRQYFDQCVELLQPHLGYDLREKIFVEDSENATAIVNQTGIAQPAIFSVAYAIAKRLEHLDIRPQRMVGHSVGEFVAACLAGVFSLEDALRLIAFRASQMQALPAGTMVAVRIKEDQLRPMIAGTQVEIAAINSLDLCVISGPAEAIEEFQTTLENADFVCRPLHTSHAFHSEMMAPVIPRFAELFSTIKLKPNRIPIISSVTGKLLTAEQAIDPLYWSRHLRETVRFADAIAELLATSENGILEVGPGQSLSTLVKQHPACAADRCVLSIQPHAKMIHHSYRHWLLTIGRLWQAGLGVQWAGLHLSASRRRVHLPTYSFERQRYWFDESASKVQPDAIGLDPKQDPGQPRCDGLELNVDETTCPSEACVTELRLPGNNGNGKTESIVTALSSLSGKSTLVEQVVRQQLQLMQQQLELWRR